MSRSAAARGLWPSSSPMLRKGRDSTKKVPSVGELCTRICAHTSRDLFQIERSYITHTWNTVHNLVTFFSGECLCVLRRAFCSGKQKQKKSWVYQQWQQYWTTDNKYLEKCPPSKCAKRRWEEEDEKEALKTNFTIPCYPHSPFPFSFHRIDNSIFCNFVSNFPPPSPLAYRKTILFK